jgi:hypothetical protein
MKEHDKKKPTDADCQAESMVRYDYARNTFLIVRFARMFFFDSRTVYGSSSAQ